MATARVRAALFVRLEAKPGQEAAVAKFLEGGLSIVEQEPATITWYALRLGPSTFGIFDSFPDDAGRQAHSGWTRGRRAHGAGARAARQASGDRVRRHPRGQAPALGRRSRRVDAGHSMHAMRMAASRRLWPSIADDAHERGELLD